MIYTDKIKYRIFEVEEGSLDAMSDFVLKQLPTDEKILRLIFFLKVDDNNRYLEIKRSIRLKLENIFLDGMPVFSLVSQAVLGAGMVMEVHSYKPEENEVLEYKTYKSIPYIVMQNDSGRFLFAGGFQSDIENLSIQCQSENVFAMIEDLMRFEKFPINSIVRQWNYLEKITAFDGENQHYQMFNNARSDFYKKTTWVNAYPAATGIGADFGGVLIDFDAVVLNGNGEIKAIDNKLQVAAHAYSDEVLEIAAHKKSTPKFERAKAIRISGRELIYISGTAAIRGEESLTDVGFEKQLGITMENIAQLIGNTHLSFLRVYLKDRAFYPLAETLLNEYELNIPISYMLADVCRNELLIEIEGIAVGDIEN